jgi:hypothetical protein
MTSRSPSFARLFGRASLLAALIGAARPVQAEPADAFSAEALFREGRSALQQGEYALACDRFRESERIEHGIGNWLNLGLCEERLGQLLSARDYYRRVLEGVAASDSRALVAREHLAALEPRLAHVVIRLASGAPAATRVTHAETSYDHASFGVPLAVDPGEQRFVVEANGYSPREYRAVFGEGQRLELVVEPGAPESRPLPDAAAGARASSAPPPQARESVTHLERDPRVTLGWSLIAGGGALLLISAVAAPQLLSDQAVVRAHCHPDKSCDDQAALDAGAQGKVLNVVTPTALAAGLVLAGTGAYLVWRLGRTPTRVSATWSGSGAGVWLARSF